MVNRLLLTVHSLAVIISCDVAKRRLFRTQTTNSWISLILNVKISIERSPETIWRYCCLVMCVQSLLYLGYLSISLFSCDFSNRSIILRYVDVFKWNDQWKSIRIASLWAEIWKRSFPNTKYYCQSFSSSFRKLTFADKPCKARRLLIIMEPLTLTDINNVSCNLMFFWPCIIV